MRIAAQVAQDKAKYPEKFCPAVKCLWRTGGGYCPRHQVKNMRVLICGDRNWDNVQCISSVLTCMKLALCITSMVRIEYVIEGEARGADTCGRIAAERARIKVLKFPADWKKYGRAAGPIRNTRMLKEGKPDLVLAFHNHFADSKGTKHMVSIAQKAGVKVRVFTETREMKFTEGRWE